MRTFVNYRVHNELRATKTLVHISSTFRSKEAKKKVLKITRGGRRRQKGPAILADVHCMYKHTNIHNKYSICMFKCYCKILNPQYVYEYYTGNNNDCGVVNVQPCGFVFTDM